MFLCCDYSDADWSISDIASIANIFIAAVNISLVYYIFVYQRQKDLSSKVEANQLHEQAIHLQWFKDLIIQPHLVDINKFYQELHGLDSKINTYLIGSAISLPDAAKDELSKFIKLEQSKLRKTFVDVLLGVNRSLYQDVLNNIDQLIDDITNVIFDDNLNLFNKPTYDKEIGSKITYSRNDLISHIFNYKGI